MRRALSQHRETRAHRIWHGVAGVQGSRRPEIPGARGKRRRPVPDLQGPGGAGARAARVAVPHPGAKGLRGTLMPIGPDLVIAYLGAEYAVFGEPGLVLRIGEASAALDELLEAEGAHTAAYVTAANPHGRLAGTAPDVLATAALLKAQRAAGHA